MAPPSPAPKVEAAPAPPADPVAAGLADELVRAAPAAWPDLLGRVRDGKGAEFTRALAAAIPRLDADRRRAARDALAERLSRMTAETLRGLMTAPDAEVRRAAVLAAAMRDDPDHAPDLIARLADESEPVVRAARAGLKSLSGGRADFGPAPDATPDQRRAAAAAWRAWWAGRKE
jgi:HEAT repeat protein